MTDTSADAIAQRRYEQARPRHAVEIDPALYADYVGHYQLPDGPSFAITVRDGHIFTRLTGQSDLEIFPESDTEFFLKVVPAQLTFVRDAKGVVSSLVHHQNGFDQVATRVDEAVSRAFEAALEKRIRDKTPLPDSEAILRRIIAENQRGAPDYDGMSAPLAAAAREQAPFIKAELASMGPLQEVSFKGVGQGGWDVYDVRFEGGDMEWRFILAPDGKFSGIFFRRTP